MQLLLHLADGGLELLRSKTLSFQLLLRCLSFKLTLIPGLLELLIRPLLLLLGFIELPLKLLLKRDVGIACSFC